MIKLSKSERKRLKLDNNFISIIPDTHYDWIRDSKGNPFLQRVTKFEAYKNSVTSGRVVQVPKTLTKASKFGTTVELKKGDKVVFNYMAIKRDRDGINISHDAILNTEGIIEYLIKYDECYARLRGKELTPINGWVFLEMEDVEINSKIFLPDYLRKKKSSSIGIIKYLGTLLTHYKEWEDEQDSDDWREGQKVIIPTYKSIPLQRPEHAIAKEKTLIRVQRKDMTDYNWVEQEIRKWTSRHDYQAPVKYEGTRLTPEEIKPYLLGVNYVSDNTLPNIVHGLNAKNRIEKRKIEAHEIAVKEHLERD